MTKLDRLVEDARRAIATHGYAEFHRETLDAGWLSAGMAPALAKALGLDIDQWERDDKRGTFVFGIAPKDPAL